MRRIFVDTSFFYAHACADDPHHREAVRFLENPPAPLITSNFIFDELVTILRYNFGHRVAVLYGQGDCTSFALMRRLGITEAAAFDIHFEIAGFLRLPPVPLPARRR